MRHHFMTQPARAVLAAGLVLGAATASAASGYSVTHDQEAMVRPGMSMAEVQIALGRPDTQHKYRTETGETLDYRVVDPEAIHFYVQFDANGTVASVGEHLDYLDGD